MNKNEFQKVLDELTEWIPNGSSAMVVAEPIKDRKHTTGKYDRLPPEKGYDVVVRWKEKYVPCSWCEDECNREKLYTRDMGSNIWKAKCYQPGCRLKIYLHTSQIGKNEPEILASTKPIDK